ncbi:MAG: MotA/TolQ/ExbB proton channel family protein [Myxococcota bacterium]
MLEVMNRGGAFMWIILFTSFFSWVLIIERSYFLYFRYRLNAEQFLNQIIGYLEEKKFSKAIEVCNVEQTHPLANVLKSGLMKANESDKDIQRSMEAATMKAVPEVTKRIPYLSMLANVATLLGLLGTILGLVESFKGVAQADAAAKQEVLSKGISVAMFTTAFGLIAAIPSIVAFTILQSRQNSLLMEIETKATDLFNYLSARNRRMAKKRA